MLCDLRDKINIIRAIEGVRELTPGQRYTISAAPVDHRCEGGRSVVRAYANCIAGNKSVTVVDIPELPLEMLEKPMEWKQDYLHGLEILHKSLILFLWLSYRFVNVFKDQAMAAHARDLVEEKINRTLVEFSANPKLRRKHYKPANEQEAKSESTKHEPSVQDVERSSMAETPFLLPATPDESFIDEQHDRPLAAAAG